MYGSMPASVPVSALRGACDGGAVRGAQRDAWAASFFGEALADTGQHHVASLIDLVKAFEWVPHHLEHARRKMWSFTNSRLGV